MADSVDERVGVAVDAWLRWVPSWQPGSHRARARLCRRCTGSPIVAAAGIGRDVPHQVTHALVSRMQRIIDRQVDAFTAAELAMLHAELRGEEMWRVDGYDPGAGLAPEFDGVDPDPVPDSDDDPQPYLFTLAGLAEETKPEPPLPRPPLTADEKRRLRHEVALADAHADEVGRAVCFALVAHRSRVVAAIERFVEPRIRELLDELSRNLEPPR